MKNFCQINQFENTGIVLTIHNLAHQGQFPAERFSLLGLPDEYFAPGREFEFYKKVNCYKYNKYCKSVRYGLL